MYNKNTKYNYRLYGNKSVKSVYEELLQTYKISDKAMEAAVIETFKRIVGETIAKQVENAHLKNKILFIQLESSVLRNELILAKSKLIQKMNDSFDIHILVDIIFK